ncbi:transketolase, partial [Candidatus Roizmanbacteria bacterium]|nr:transketolase [Candidatus Roizmanbacteria bacterium]
MDTQKLEKLCKLIRYFILTATTAAASGHPTTSLSGTELMATLFFGGFYHYDLSNPHNPKNDRVIFSKGHGSPLLYALYAAAGAVAEEELMTLRKINSDLEGHPTPRFRYTEAPTGSLGQGLSIGLGMAMAGAPCVYTLLGDGEMAEGNVWEALGVAGHYKIDNLVGILDVNRL